MSKITQIIKSCETSCENKCCLSDIIEVKTIIENDEKLINITLTKDNIDTLCDDHPEKPNTISITLNENEKSKFLDFLNKTKEMLE